LEKKEKKKRKKERIRTKAKLLKVLKGVSNLI
jgi:hypothetical protein